MTFNTDILLKLDKVKQITFGWLAAKRFFNGYQIFSEVSHFGNVELMKEAVNFIYDFITSEYINKNNLEKMLTLVDNNIPDTDDYGSPISSSALNVGGIIYETLNIINGKIEYQSIKDISMLATDNIDMIIQQIKNFNHPDKCLEEEITNHPLMMEELKIQKDIVDYLNNISKIEVNDLLVLAELQNNRIYENIDLRVVLTE